MEVSSVKAPPVSVAQDQLLLYELVDQSRTQTEALRTIGRQFLGSCCSPKPQTIVNYRAQIQSTRALELRISALLTRIDARQKFDEEGAKLLRESAVAIDIFNEMRKEREDGSHRCNRHDMRKARSCQTRALYLLADITLCVGRTLFSLIRPEPKPVITLEDTLRRFEFSDQVLLQKYFKENPKERAEYEDILVEDQRIQRLLDIIGVVETSIAEDKEMSRVLAAADEFYERHLSERFKLDRCARDGDCLYHGFRKLLKDEAVLQRLNDVAPNLNLARPRDVTEVRRILQNYMIANQNFLLGDDCDPWFVFEARDDEGTPLEGEARVSAFKDEIETVGELAHESGDRSGDNRAGWGMPWHARWLAEAIGVHVVIYTHTGHHGAPLLLNEKAKTWLAPTLYLLYNGRNHWDRLVPWADLEEPADAKESKASDAKELSSKKSRRKKARAKSEH